MLTTFDAALSWVDQGFSVIPIGYKDKRPAFDALAWAGSYGAEGKPSWETYKNRQPSRDELELWFNKGPRHNLGIVTGFNNLVVLDFDVMGMFEAWESWGALAGGAPAICAEYSHMVQTSRGMHVYLRPDTCCDSYKAGCVDVKARWGYVLAPPSVHPSGHVYRGYGEMVFRCGDVGEVFPLKADAQTFQAPTVVAASDPYVAAAEARECGCGMGVIEAIKERVTIADVLGLVAGTRIIRCPVHNDKTPSFYIYSDGHFKCFGCGIHGDVLDLVSLIERRDRTETIAILAERIGWAR